MNALRFSSTAMASTTVLAIAAALASTFGSAAGCGNNYNWVCAAPDGGELGTGVSGDPATCPCTCCTLGPQPDVGGPSHYPVGDCPFADGGTDGPIPGLLDGGTDDDPSDAGIVFLDGSFDGQGSSCTGSCLPAVPARWGPPVLLGIGTPTDAPTCPNAADDAVVYKGNAGLTASPASCGTCSCAGPSGSCELPATLTASSTPCPGAGSSAILTHFDPPSGWEGACANDEAVPSGTPIQSLTIAPLTVQESCTPSPSIATTTPLAWAQFAWACFRSSSGTCAHGEVCAGITATPSFLECVFDYGDVDCPSAYTDKHVFYTGADDTRGCSMCTCGSPTGSTCSALVSVWSDGNCSTPLLSDLVDSNKPVCVDLIPGSALGSKSAGPAKYTPGACGESGGGDPIGSATPVTPTTFCCLPPVKETGSQ